MKQNNPNKIDKSGQIFGIIGQINEDLIAKAEVGIPKSARQLFWNIFGNNKYMKYAMGALVVVAICIGIAVGINKVVPDHPGQSSALPMITIPLYENPGMGSETYLAKEITELTGTNPWTERIHNSDSSNNLGTGSDSGANSDPEGIATLPVIRNKLQYNKDWMVSNPDLKHMQSNLEKAAKTLGMDSKRLPITNDIPDEETQEAIREKLGTVSDDYFISRNLYMEGAGSIANTDTQIKLAIDANQTITAEFTNPIVLPKEYSYTDASTYEEVYKTAQYIQEHCKEYLNMKEPKITIMGGDYDIYGKQHYTIAFYDHSGSLVEQILNYNFNKTLFYCDEQGNLSMTRTYQPDLTEVIGSYPVISQEEAIALAENKHYQTSVPEAFPGAESIRRIELIYRTSAEDALYLPYYRIYAEMPSQSDEPSQSDLTAFGAYYVPAIESSYIQNMPLWNGSFN